MAYKLSMYWRDSHEEMFDTLDEAADAARELVLQHPDAGATIEAPGFVATITSEFAAVAA